MGRIKKINSRMAKYLLERAILDVVISESFSKLRSINLNEAVVKDGIINQDAKTSKISFNHLSPKDAESVVRLIKSKIPEIVKSYTKEIFGSVMYAYKEGASPITIDGKKYVMLLKYKSGVDSKTKFDFDNVSLMPLDANNPSILDMPDGPKKSFVDLVDKSKKTAKTIQLTDQEVSEMKQKPLPASEEVVDEPVKEKPHRLGSEKPSKKTQSKVDVDDDGNYTINGDGLNTSDYDYDEAKFGKNKSDDSEEIVDEPEMVDGPDASEPESKTSKPQEENPAPENPSEVKGEPIEFNKKNKTTKEKQQKLANDGVDKTKLIDLVSNLFNDEAQFSYTNDSVRPVASLYVSGINFYCVLEFNASGNVSDISVYDTATHNFILLSKKEQSDIIKKISQEKLKTFRQNIKENSKEDEASNNEEPIDNPEASVDVLPTDDNMTTGSPTPEEPTSDESPKTNEPEYSEEEIPSEENFVSIDSEKYAKVDLKPKDNTNANILKSLSAKVSSLNEADYDKYRVSEDVLKLVPRNEKGLTRNNGGKSAKIIPILIYTKNETGEFELSHIGIKTVKDQKRQTAGILLSSSDFNNVTSNGIGAPTIIENADDAKIISDELDFPKYDEKGKEVKEEPVADSAVRTMFKVFGSKFKNETFKTLSRSLTAFDEYSFTKNKEFEVKKNKFKVSFTMKIGDDGLYLSKISAKEKGKTGYVDIMSDFDEEQKQEALNVFNEATDGKFSFISYDDFKEETKLDAYKQKMSNDNDGQESMMGEPTAQDSEEIPDTPVSDEEPKDDLDSSEENPIPNETPEENQEINNPAPEEEPAGEPDPEVDETPKEEPKKAKSILKSIVKTINTVDIDQIKTTSESYMNKRVSFSFSYKDNVFEAKILLSNDDDKWVVDDLYITNIDKLLPGYEPEEIEKLLEAASLGINPSRYGQPENDSSEVDLGDLNYDDSEEDPTSNDEPTAEPKKKSFKDKVKDRFNSLMNKHKNRNSLDDEDEYDNNYYNSEEDYDEPEDEPNDNHGNPNSFMGKAGRTVNKAFNTIGKAAYNTGKAVRQGTRDFKAGYKDEKEKNKNQDHNKFFRNIKNNAGRNLNRVSHTMRNGINEGENNINLIILEQIDNTIIKHLDAEDTDFINID